LQLIPGILLGNRILIINISRQELLTSAVAKSDSGVANWDRKVKK
jgi:hypothetical protein